MDGDVNQLDVVRGHIISAMQHSGILKRLEPNVLKSAGVVIGLTFSHVKDVGTDITIILQDVWLFQNLVAKTEL